MIFSSVEFFLFLGMLLLLLAATPREQWRRHLLLGASYVFYGWWDWRFCLLILASTVVDFVVGLRLSGEGDARRRRAWLVLSICANLGVLGFFKYANFFIDSVRPLLGAVGLGVGTLDVILPVGISFYTFQTMSYSIDVFRGRLEATRSFTDFALFVAFFPQLVAGPIVRGVEFLPQLARNHPLAVGNLRVGASIFLRGFVKKVLFADTLAIYADGVFAEPAMWSTPTCWLGVVAYAGQIYYDFSGYSEMAIGVGRMLGYQLPTNFLHPYLSLSVTEFWRRWHITLSSWLRDYLYIPLGGNRHGRVQTYRNLALTMLLGGLWHGAAWTFVAWGALHGGALALHKFRMEWGEARENSLPGLPAPLAWLATFVFVLVTWVFFRATSFGVAGEMLARMVGQGAPGVDWFHVPSLVALGAGAVMHLWVAARGERDLQLDLGTPGGWLLAAGILLLVLLYAPFGNSPFIYFQF